MLKRQSTVGFPAPNISDQSQACETRSCLFLHLCSEVEVCTDIYTAHHCCFCIIFKNQRAVHHFQVIRRAVQKAYYHCSRTTADYSVKQVSQGLISATKAGRVKRGRVCFCVLASESTSVLIYILNTVYAVLLCITFKTQRAVHHFQVTR